MSHDIQQDPETPPRLRWPMGLSGRGFGAICLLGGIAVMAANVASFVVFQRYWRWAFLLPPALVFVGLGLVILPERLTRLDSGSKGVGSKLVGALLLLALLGGLVVGGFLAYDPASTMRWIGLH